MSHDVSLFRLSLGYVLLLIPLSMLLWYRVPLVGRLIWGAIRMTVQLLFVGFYLQVVFKLNNAWLNLLWLMVMIVVADLSIVRGCQLRISRFLVPLFLALLAGTLVPAGFFITIVFKATSFTEAQYLIPISGMILGNCLRADIVALRDFYQGIRKQEKMYQFSLSQGAGQLEALRPFISESLQTALMPTLATMANIGLVSLPGMMTGVILAGANPVTAIKYQIMIMVAIFSGTALTIGLALRLTIGTCFTPYGLLDQRIFKVKNYR